MAAISPSATKGPVEALASRQYGLITRDQALEAGVSASSIKYFVNSGRWRRVHRGVYRIAGAPETWLQALLAACLLGGENTLASHKSAAALLTLEGSEPGAIEISTERNLRQKNMVIHRVRTFPSADVYRVKGIPCTDPVRTLIDLGSIVPEEPLEIAMHDVLFRYVSPARLQWRLDYRDMRGRPGVGVIRQWVEELGPRGKPSQTGLEVRTYRLLVRSELPAPVRQHPVVVGGRTRYIDLAYPDALLAIETDGYKYHHAKSKWESDRVRSNELQVEGWHMLHVTNERLRRDPQGIVANVASFLGRSRLLYDP